MLNLKTCEEMGANLRAAGKTLTPFDCREIDATLFADARAQTEVSVAKRYAKTRGAVNRGFMKKHAEMVAG